MSCARADAQSDATTSGSRAHRVVLVGHEHRIPVRGQAVHVLLQIPRKRRVVLPHEAARVLGAERAAQAAQHLARVQVPCRNDHRGIAQLAVRHPPRCAILQRVRGQGALAHQRVQRGAVAEVAAQPLLPATSSRGSEF